MAAQQEVIKSFMKSLDETTKSGTAALNEAVAALTNNAVTSIQTIINQMVADCKETANATKFLSDYCGINLSNTDTGAITGLDAGSSTTAKTAENIVNETGTYAENKSNSFTVGKTTFQLDSKYTYSTLTAAQKYIWNGLKSLWTTPALKLITDSYGTNYGIDTNALGTNNTITVTFSNKNNGTLASAGASYVKSGEFAGVCKPTTLNVNTYYYGNYDTSDKNGTSSLAGAGYLDRTLAHEFTHSAMANNIRYFYNLPQFIKEGMAELTHGIDDERKYRINLLAGNYKSLNSALNLKNTGTGSEPAYAGGYMFLRYLAKEMQKYSWSKNADIHSNYSTLASALEGNDTVRNRISNATVDGGAGNDYLINKNAKVSLFGGAGNDTIESKVANVTLNGGAGDDSIIASNTATIIAGAGNDTITGAGKNVYMFGNSDGNNLITKFVPGTDVIYFTGIGDISGVTTLHSSTGNDMILKAGTTAVTLTGAGSSTVKVRYFETASNKVVTKSVKSPMFTADDNYYDNSKASTVLSALAGNDTITNSANKVKLVGGDGNDSLISAAGTTAITLQGGNGADFLSADSKAVLKGEADNDTILASGNSNALTGGAGDDYISVSGGGLNTYVYGNNDGSDTIKGWQGTDLLQLTGIGNATQIAQSNIGNDLLLGFGNSSVRIVSPGTVRAKLKNNKIVVLKHQATPTNNADYIINSVEGSSKNWQMAAGDDSVYNYLAGTTIDGGADNDYIYNYKDATASNIIGSAGNDSLYTQAANVTLSGGADNDYLNSTAASVTSSGGTGNDTIALNGAAKFNVINYGAGDGLDIVTGFNTDDKLNITSGYYVTLKSGKDLIVKVGNDTKAADDYITLKNVSKANIVGTALSPNYYASGLGPSYVGLNAKTTFSAISSSVSCNIDMGYYPTVKAFSPIPTTISGAVTVKGNWQADLIQGGNGADSLNGFLGNNTILGGGGNDTIIGSTGAEKLYGGTGSDYIEGGAGNDYIVGDLEKETGADTIDGGAGNDSIWGGNGADVFVFSAGKDVIQDYSSEDKIYLGDYDYTYSISGYNVVFKSGSNTMTVKNALYNGNSITFYDAKNPNQITSFSYSGLLAEDDNFISKDSALVDDLIMTPIVGDDYETATTSRDTVQSNLTYSNEF